MTFEDLLASGYRPYPAPQYDRFTRRAAQKVVRDGSTKLYFINVLESLWPDGRLHLSVEVHFYDGLSGYLVKRDANDLSVEQVEQFFDKIYTSCGCIPDIYNND